ncbi:hypothetical protein Tco_0156355 [Tanacetum coccineum]
MEDVRYQHNTSSLQERRMVEYEAMWYWLQLVIEKLLSPSGNLHKWVSDKPWFLVTSSNTVVHKWTKVALSLRRIRL